MVYQHYRHACVRATENRHTCGRRCGESAGGPSRVCASFHLLPPCSVLLYPSLHYISSGLLARWADCIRGWGVSDHMVVEQASY